MDAYERFHQLLKRDFIPLLREDGFKGSGTTFRRSTGERIDVINVQGSRYGGRCCVNLAAHFTFLPTEGSGRAIDPKKITAHECVFRDRLHESTESDHWWPYGESDLEAEASLVDLVDMYKRRGTPFFAQFEPFPNVFERMTPADIDAGDLSKMPAAMTVVYAALTLAQIMKHMGRLESCREFAEAGLRQVGRSAGLKWELERLRDVS
jgi:hypothetical protein